MNRCLAPIILVATVLSVAGCDWQPVRDNTVDPDSPYYQVPPPENHPPQIDSIFVVTDCRNNVSYNYCAFDVVAYISDPDQNIVLSSVSSSIELTGGNWEPMGRMGYDPVLERFVLTKTQSEFPDESILDLFGKAVRVDVHDAAGAADSSSMVFPLPLLDWPVIISPPDHGVVTTNYPRLSWLFWHGQTGEHRFSVCLLRNAYELMWDTAGLAPSDTFVIVTDSLPDNQFAGGFYIMELTVTDGNGNRATSISEFQVLPDRPRDLGLTSAAILEWRSRRRRPEFAVRNAGSRRGIAGARGKLLRQRSV